MSAKLGAFLGLLSVVIVAGTVRAEPVTGTTSGVWTNPHPAGLTVSADGSSLRDGGAPVSMITFHGGAFGPTEGVGSLGSFTAVNSANYGVADATADLNVTFSLTSPTGATQTVVIPVSYHATLNVGSAVQQADTWTLLSLPTLSFQEDGYNFLVQILGFDGFTGGGFGDATHFTIYENTTAQAHLQANITSHHPEPASLAVWSILAVGGYAVHRLRRKQAEGRTL